MLRMSSGRYSGWEQTDWSLVTAWGATVVGPLTLPYGHSTVVVFDLDVQIETALTRVALVALPVRAKQLSLDLVRTAPIVLLTPRQVPLAGRPLKILVAVIKLLELQNALQKRVSFFGV